jgi:hypothetical protein
MTIMRFFFFASVIMWTISLTNPFNHMIISSVSPLCVETHSDIFHNEHSVWSQFKGQKKFTDFQRWLIEYSFPRRIMDRYPKSIVIYKIDDH